MKKTSIFIVAIILSLLGYGQLKKNTSELHCISLLHAEIILGRSAKLIESKMEETDTLARYKCTYTLLAPTSKTCNLYYMFENYADTVWARKVYAAAVSSNRGMVGQKTISNLGDEAFLHTDTKHFNFIIFRKGNKLLRIKVNKITQTTSLKEMEQVARSLASFM